MQFSFQVVIYTQQKCQVFFFFFGGGDRPLTAGGMPPPLPHSLRTAPADQQYFYSHCQQLLQYCLVIVSHYATYVQRSFFLCVNFGKIACLASLMHLICT